MLERIVAQVREKVSRISLLARKILGKKLKCIKIHLVVVVAPERVNDVDMGAIGTAVAAAKNLFEKAADIVLDDQSVIFLKNEKLEVIDVGSCKSNLTDTQLELFRDNRGGVSSKEVVVYFVRAITPTNNGCASHPPDAPGVIVVRGTNEWVVAHELGHLFGLDDFSNTKALMTDSGTDNIKDPPPDLSATEVETMQDYKFLLDC